MRILITGANGFLGSNIVDKLLGEGHNIYALSVNNSRLKGKEGIKFESVKMDNISSKRQKILSFKPDIAIHCAWIGGNSYKDPNDIKQFDNIRYGLEFLKILTEVKGLYFVSIGSMAEYGPRKSKLREADQENPVSLYGMCKYMFNLYSKYICESNGLKWLWIRPSYVYGTDDVETRLIPRVISKCLSGENILLDSCSSIVDYVYIDDFVEGVSKLISSSSQGVYNICSGKEYHIKEVLEAIIDISNSEATIIFNRSLDRKGHPDHVCGSNEKICQKTGWSPQVELGQGLKYIVDPLIEEK